LSVIAPYIPSHRKDSETKMLDLSDPSSNPPTDVTRVLRDEIKEWHFHIYFLLNNHTQAVSALKLRDAVLTLRKEGVFVAVPLFRVNTTPIGPHPVGSYEIWCPKESFASVFSYLSLHRGDLSVLIHPLTKQERADHENRNAWMGPSFPLNLDVLPLASKEVPSQYHSLKLGYSSEAKKPDRGDLKKEGKRIEEILKGEPEAA